MNWGLTWKNKNDTYVTLETPEVKMEATQKTYFGNEGQITAEEKKITVTGHPKHILPMIPIIATQMDKRYTIETSLEDNKKLLPNK